MDITPEIPADRNYIDRYVDGGFCIGGELYEGSVIVAPEQVWPWAVTTMVELTVESVADIFSADPPVDLLLIGCGVKSGRVPINVREALKAKAIFTDGMDTGAACRTYNVLMAEERRVAAALIAI